MSSTVEDSAFQRAHERFRASLTKAQQKQFASCNKQDVQNTIDEIQNRHGSQRRQKNMRRVSKFVEGMSQLGQVVEVFLNVEISVAFLWGPIKFMLLAASSHLESLDLLLDTYAEIGETLPGLRDFGTLYDRYPAVGNQLENYYYDVLEFNKSALEVFSRPMWKKVFNATWKTFKTKFGPILSSFRRHQKLLSEEKLTALMSELQGMKHATEDSFEQVAKNLSSIVEQDRAKMLAEQDERLCQQRRILRDELRSPDYLQDQEHSFSILRDSSWSNWITNEAIFKDWSDLLSSQLPLIFLSGIPGAGKTTLVSGIVDHLLKLKRTTDASGRKMSVTYFYFKHMQDDKRHLLALMRSILSQLVDQDPSLLDIVYQKLCKNNRLAFDQWKELTEAAIHTQPLCFLIVDGLDECARDENARTSETAKVLEWLRGLIASSPDGQSSNIRIFVSGQRDGVIEERLKDTPMLQLENMKQHMDDIERYAQDEARKICRKFSRSPIAVERNIVERITTASGGMFLYVKVVLDNLLMQTSVFGFETEMKDGNFPKKLEQAYARVVERVLRNPQQSERMVAERILGWVTCARRPLRWREIQSLFCVDPKTETSDMRNLPCDPCKYYCSSLVDITECNEDTNESRVEIVHISAKQFLVYTGSICLTAEHAKMAIFSFQYLTSRPFEAQTVDDLRQYALDGYYNLHDYAVTSWWYHANQSFEHISSCPMDIASEMEISLSRHLRKYFPARANGNVIDGTSDQVLVEFRQLSADDRTREESGSLEQHTRAIRGVLETFWKLMRQLPEANESVGLQLYGPTHYKCPHSWCHRFEDGFSQCIERDNHTNQHLRPFRCTVDGCYAISLGFSSQPQLQQHDRRHHQVPEEPRFPVSKRPKEYQNMWAAIRDGALEAIDAIFQKNSSQLGFFPFEKVNPATKTTPLRYAVDYEKYDICQYFLSKGALSVDRNSDSTLYHVIYKNDADLVNLFISHLQATELMALMEFEFNRILKTVSAEARGAFINALERHHPRFVISDEWLQHALRMKQPECIKSFFLLQNPGDKRETILPLLIKSYDVWMDSIMSTNEECFQTLLYEETEDLVIKQIFFEACGRGMQREAQLAMSRLSSIALELSEWITFEKHLESFKSTSEHRTVSHPLVRVIEQLRPRNVWTILGTTFQFLPLEPWLLQMNKSALRELLRSDDVLLRSRDERGAMLLHGYVYAGDLDMVKFISSLDIGDHNAEALPPVPLLTSVESRLATERSTCIPMYRPDQIKHQEMLSETEKEHYESSLQHFGATLAESPPNSIAHETAKSKISDISRIIRDRSTTFMHRSVSASACTPIGLALNQQIMNKTAPGRSFWNGKEIVLTLLNTGCIDISCYTVTDELLLLVGAAGTGEACIMQAIVRQGHSKLCPILTMDEAHSLVHHLPSIAGDLLMISALESGNEIVSRELGFIKQAEYTEMYSLIDSLVEHKNFSIARKLLLQSYNDSVGSDERKAMMEYAIGTNDTSLLRKLMNEDVINRAVSLIAADGLPALFVAVPRDRHTIKNIRGEDGKTPLQVAQFHHNTAVEQWLSEPDN